VKDAAFCRSIRGTAPEKIVSKGDAMADKTVLAQGNVLADESVGLYFGSVANDTSFLYLNKWPDKNIIAQGTFIEVYRHDYFHIFTLCYITNAAFKNLHTRYVLTWEICAQNSLKILTSGNSEALKSSYTPYCLFPINHKPPNTLENFLIYT
jgi:hypothetical protein